MNRSACVRGVCMARATHWRRSTSSIRWRQTISQGEAVSLRRPLRRGRALRERPQPPAARGVQKHRTTSRRLWSSAVRKASKVMSSSHSHVAPSRTSVAITLGCPRYAPSMRGFRRICHGVMAPKNDRRRRGKVMNASTLTNFHATRRRPGFSRLFLSSYLRRASRTCGSIPSRPYRTQCSHAKRWLVRTWPCSWPR